MNDRTPVGLRLILNRHTGGGTVGGNVGGGSPTAIQPNQFGLPDDLANALLHPFWDLKEKTRGPFVVGVVADYATRLVRLINAETQIESAVKVVLEQFNGKLRVISFAIDLEKHCFTSITIRVELNGQPLYPEAPRPPNLSGDIRQAVADVLQPLGITPPHIIIPSDYSESHEPQEIQKGEPTRLSPPTQPRVAEVEADTDESGTPS